MAGTKVFRHANWLPAYFCSFLVMLFKAGNYLSEESQQEQNKKNNREAVIPKELFHKTGF